MTHLEFERMYSPQTLRAYHTDLCAWARYLDGEPTHTASKQSARAYIMAMVESRKKRPKSINRTISTLRGYYTFLRSQGVVEINPTATIKNIPQGEQLPKFIPQTSMEPVVEAMQMVVETSQSFDQITRATVVLFLYYTGVRNSEICGLKVTDLTPDTIRVLGKGQKTRNIPICQQLQAILQIYIKKRAEKICNITENFLFLVEVRGRVRPLGPTDVRNITKQALSTNPHTLRHTFATHLLQHEVGIRSIQELLGHSSIDTTQVYAHNSIETLKNAYLNAHPRAIDRKSDY